MPMMMLVTWVITDKLALAETAARILVGAGTVLTTLVASDLLYRLVERPMITLGARPAGRHPGRRMTAKKRPLAGLIAAFHLTFLPPIHS